MQQKCSRIEQYDYFEKFLLRTRLAPSHRGRCGARKAAVTHPQSAGPPGRRNSATGRRVPSSNQTAVSSWCRMPPSGGHWYCRATLGTGASSACCPPAHTPVGDLSYTCQTVLVSNLLPSNPLLLLKKFLSNRVMHQDYYVKTGNYIIITVSYYPQNEI